MIGPASLSDVVNAGGIIAIEVSDLGVEIVLEEGIKLLINKNRDNGSYEIFTDILSIPEKKDEGSPLMVLSLTIWPGQDQEKFLDLLDTAVRRAQGVL